MPDTDHTPRSLFPGFHLTPAQRHRSARQRRRRQAVWWCPLAEIRRRRRCLPRMEENIPRLPPWALKFRWRGPPEYVIENLSDSETVHVHLRMTSENDDRPESDDPRIKVHRIQ